jgi:hypothetical protein
MSNQEKRTGKPSHAGDSNADQSTKTKRKPKSFADFMRMIIENDDNKLTLEISVRISEIITSHGLENYKTILLFDDSRSISDFHADQIYAAASTDGKHNSILLILHSGGGRIEPAYLISKSLKRLADKFIAVVPRRAKSAATLICLGADEIHMGIMSQLGPLDPQIGRLPVQALGNALETLADIACRYPAAAEMLTKYLSDQAPLQFIGYYKRLNESAVQYGERLLHGKQLPPDKTEKQVAEHLVNHYKDHGFVIDIDEAKLLLGVDTIKENTSEYKASDEIFQLLDFISIVSEIHNKKTLSYVGSIENGLRIRPVQQPDATPQVGGY